MKRISISDAVRYAALAAAMGISFATQRDLAVSHGVPVAVPLTADEIRSAMAALGSKRGRPVTGHMLADHFSVSDRTSRRDLVISA